MKIISTKYRTKDEEVMDDFYLGGNELEEVLQDLDKVNLWLGGSGITLNGIQKLLPKDRKIPVKIVDVGCGNGMILRKIAEYARKENLNLELVGIDANAYSIELAKKLSASFPNISYRVQNIFSDAFEELKADIFLCTLTLHHFTNEQIEELLKLLCANSTYGVVINDLQRSKSAYYLFKIFCAVFIKNEIARKDGLISIRRGFKKDELQAFSKKLGEEYSLSWKWAFRYQLILYKNKELEI